MPRPLAPLNFGTRGPGFVFRRAWRTITHPVFAILTLCGNGVIALASYGLYLAEKGTNPAVNTYFDALWWAVSTVTTVGYGDIVPVTVAGRLLAMGTMILGTAFFWAFTSLFTATLLAPEISEVEHEMRHVERTLERMQRINKSGE